MSDKSDGNGDKPQRIGVFLCRCADNIAGAVDFEALKEQAGELDGVVHVAEHNLLCAPDGKQLVREVVEQQALSHVVVGACSPKDHEGDFKQALEQAGVNPYMLQMANIREHCTWVTKDPARAHDKARAMLRAAHRRVRLHEALHERSIEANPDVLVIGGGIAGMEAALAAAGAGRKVTLVERSPSLGGRVPSYEEVAPNNDCGPCLVAPRLSLVADHPSIEIITAAEVDKIVGFIGNFTATVTRRARQVDPELCIGCDECMNVCPVEAPDAFNEGMSARKAIYIPFPGSVPNCAMIDREVCVRDVTSDDGGESCTACQLACPMEAVDFEQSDSTEEIEAGAVIVATGFTPFDPSGIEALGHGALPEVYTLPEFERLCSATGPTEGKIVNKDGTPPESIAVLHCVGRSQLGYCSGVCCQPSMLVASFVKHQELDCQVTYLHSDLVLPATGGRVLKQRAEADGAAFVAVASDAGLSVANGTNGSSGVMTVGYHDPAGVAQQLQAEMVVLVTGMTPTRTAVTEMLDLVTDDHGFVAADHPLMRPAEASLEGVFLAGCAGGPRNIGESIATAHAAAGLAMARVQPGKELTVEVITAQTDEAQCSGCLICVSSCPYHAPTKNPETGLVEVNEVLCRGCGACVAACAGGAARARHFTDRQLVAEMEEVLDG